MGNRPRPKDAPFHPEIGTRVGTGQDNAVHQLHYPGEKPHLNVPTGYVLKINHDNDHRQRDPDPRRAAELGIRYKKNKYDTLKAFLGDVIPDSSFVLGTVRDKGRVRYAEYTIQKEVPRTSLHQLSDEQRRDPRLENNIRRLMKGLQRMYRIMGEVNARTKHGVSLDGTLDLGGVSKYVLSEDLEGGLQHDFTHEDVVNVIDTNKSPNLLIDPESMQPYCIDFDQGQWGEGMDEAKEKALALLERERAKDLGRIALGGQEQLELF